MFPLVKTQFSPSQKNILVLETHWQLPNHEKTEIPEKNSTYFCIGISKTTTWIEEWRCFLSFFRDFLGTSVPIFFGYFNLVQPDRYLAVEDFLMGQLRDSAFNNITIHRCTFFNVPLPSKAIQIQ